MVTAGLEARKENNNMFITIFKTIFKTILIALIVAIITPIPYFAWRMDQPLRYKDFNGLNYYQYIDWVGMEHQANAASGKYKASDCQFNNQFTQISGVTMLPAQAFISATGGLLGAKPNPAHGLVALPDDYYAQADHSSVNGWASYVTVDTTILNFLPKWWNAYEFLFWYNQETKSQAENFKCPIHTTVPSPDQYQAMKQANQQASVVK